MPAAWVLTEGSGQASRSQEASATPVGSAVPGCCLPLGQQDFTVMDFTQNEKEGACFRVSINAGKYLKKALKLEAAEPPQPLGAKPCC